MLSYLLLNSGFPASKHGLVMRGDEMTVTEGDVKRLRNLARLSGKMRP